MREALVAILFVLGCGSGDSDALGISDGTPPEAPQECTLPNVGAAPRACVNSDDCFWSQCSTSACIKGQCEHRKRADGAVCPAPELGIVGTCDECICTIET